MKIRSVQVSDYDVISPIINEWWGGRPMANKLPKLFFVHFTTTSFIAELDGKMVGFLIGFLSPSHQDEGYIHFVGVHPDYRKHHVGRELYHRFFAVMRENGRSIARAVTSPVNEGSIAYHTKMGFEIEKATKKWTGYLSLLTTTDPIRTGSYL